MLIAAIVLFAAAACGGVVLALKIRGGEKPPMPLALGHGALAAVGLVLLLLVVLDVGFGGTLTLALALFAGAALGGFALFGMHLGDKPQPIGIVAVHGLVAVAAFVVLLIAYLG